MTTAKNLAFAGLLLLGLSACSSTQNSSMATALENGAAAIAPIVTAGVGLVVPGVAPVLTAGAAVACAGQAAANAAGDVALSNALGVACKW